MQPIPAQHRRQVIRPSVRPNFSAAAKQQQQHQNFPTLKTERMMRAAPSVSMAPGEGPGGGVGGVGGGISGSQSDVAAGAADEGVRLDDIYSFSAIKRLCSRHMKKLQQEQDRLEVSRANRFVFFGKYLSRFIH